MYMYGNQDRFGHATSTIKASTKEYSAKSRVYKEKLQLDQAILRIQGRN